MNFSFTTAALFVLTVSTLQAELPAWVKGTPEAITLKQASETPAYLTIQQTVTLTRPLPLTQLADLEKLNPGLSEVLPSLGKLLPAAKVSAKFTTLYDAKVEAVKGGYLMPTHHFFDTPTALTFTAPETGRKVFLFQSDMDVDTDGSDPVRMSKLKDYDDALLSRSYQPLLAYSWAKAESETAVSPFIRYYQDALGKLRTLKQEVDEAAKLDLNPLWPELQESLEGYISGISRKANYYAQDLRLRRSLIASQDPFIVIPQTWAGDVAVGDYVAVIHAGKVYPCLSGDTGPTTKGRRRLSATRTRHQSQVQRTLSAP